MKKLAGLAPLALVLFAPAVMAQDMPATDAPVETPAEAPAEEEVESVDVPDTVIPTQESNEILGSWMLDTDVTSPDGEVVGPVQDILIDQESGELTGVVLGVGGFLGIGAKSIAVDWEDLELDYDALEITSSLTREEAEAAPEYEFREQETPEPEGGDMGAGMGGDAAPAPAPM